MDFVMAAQASDFGFKFNNTLDISKKSRSASNKSKESRKCVTLLFF